MVDIVILTYNRSEKIKVAIQSILDNRISNYRIVVYPEYENLGTVKKLNEHLKFTRSDIIVYLADDVKLYPDCLEKAVQCMQSNFPEFDGLVGINQVNIPNGCKSAFGLIGRKFADRFPDKQCFCPDYIHFYVDTEVGQYAQEVKRFKFCEEAKLIHYHPSVCSEMIDQTHITLRNRSKQRDDETWQKRQRKGLLWGRTFDRVK